MNINTKLILKISSIFVLYSTSVLAETKLVLCKGIWTTKACDQPEKSLDAVEYVEPVKKEVDATPVENTENKTNEKVVENTSKNTKEISSALHPLNMKVSEIKTKYNKDFNISQVEETCKDQKLTLLDCKKAVSNSLDKARDYEIKLEELELEEKQLEESVNNNTPKGDTNVVSVTQVTTQVEKNTTVNVQPKK
jgi:hypothetical protein